MATKKIEIERKFLLKRLPVLDYTEAPKIIQQCYEWDEVLQNHIRYRAERGQDGHELFYTTIKTPVEGIKSEAVVKNEEEEVITKEEFVKKFGSSDKKIGKIRYLHTENGLTFEIDKFMNMDLVVAEVELESEDQEVVFPEAIQKELIKEVSSLKEFSNYSLADEMPT